MATKREKRKDLVKVHRTHLRVKKDLVFDGTLCVGGNLVVHGNLNVDALYCAGSITVQGDIEIGTLITPNSLSCSGRLSAISIYVGMETLELFVNESWKFWLPTDHSVRWSSLADAKTFLQLEKDYGIEEHARCEDSNVYLVNVGKDLQCFVAEVGGSLFVEGKFDAEIGDVRGFANVGSIKCDGTLDIGQSLEVGFGRQTPVRFCAAQLDSETWIGGSFSCLGNLYSDGIEVVSLKVHGDCDISGDLLVHESLHVDGKITSHGKISAGGYIKVGGLIASKSYIDAGSDYGIFAGLDVPRSEWGKRGYICSSKKPKNIFSGAYFTRKQKFPWKHLNEERQAFFAEPNLKD